MRSRLIAILLAALLLAGARAEVVAAAALRRAQDALTDTRKAMDHELAQRLQRERVTIAKAEARKARLLLAGDLKQRDRQLRELQDHLNANTAKLAQAQKAQAEVMRKSRELDDAKRELDLQVEDKVQASLAKVRSTAKAEAEAHLKAKVLGKETQIAGMQRQIELLRRRADQGSQQLQGEAFEQQVRPRCCRPVPLAGRATIELGPNS